MLKTKAIELLGGTPSSAAAAIGITPQAVTDWPDKLPQRIEDRVLAALYRQENPERVRSLNGKRPRGRSASDRPAARGHR